MSITPSISCHSHVFTSWIIDYSDVIAFKRLTICTLLKSGIASLSKWNMFYVMIQQNSLYFMFDDICWWFPMVFFYHYSDVIMTTIASRITNLTIVYSIVYSDADQRKHQRSTSLAFVWGIHRWPVNSTHKRPVTQIFFLSIWWRHHVLVLWFVTHTWVWVFNT